MDGRVPDKIGPYLLESILGRGGMGEVYRAYDARLDRHVAIKQVRPGRATQESARLRLRREAKAAAALAHPAIVQVFDILETDTGDWIVMELVKGQSLAGRLRDGPLDIGVVIDVGRDVAAGLAYAHDRGLIHRDLKAENVMLSDLGQAKILDFGLAKNLVQDETSLTAEGTLVGTWRAMSPEQARGGDLDGRSDLFSLGVLLFESLTASSPFEADSGAATLMKICTHPHQPVQQLNPEVPDDLARLIDQLLAKLPQERPPSAAAVLEILDQSRRGSRQAPPPGREAEPPAAELETIEGSWDHSAARGRPTAAGTSGSRKRLALTVSFGLVIPLTLWSASWLAGFRPSPETPAMSSSLVGEETHHLYRQGMELLERYDKLGNLEAALDLFEGMVKGFPQSATAHAGLSRALWRRYRRFKQPEDLSRAASSARAAVELDEFVAAGHVSLGLAYLDQGRGDEAVTALDTALRLDPSSADAHLGLALHGEASGQIEEAEALFRRALEIRPQSRELWDFLGRLFLRQVRLEEAEGAFLRSIELAPDNTFGYQNLAGVYFMQDRLDEAVSLLSKALEIRPHADLYSNLGNIFFYQGRYEDAISPFKKAVELAEGSHKPLLWANLGDAYRWAPGYDEEAREAYRRSVELVTAELQSRPRDFELKSRLALYLARGGRSEEALKVANDLADAVAIDPSSMFRLTMAYEQCGERQQALKALARALALGFPKSAIDREQELDRLRADPGFARIVSDDS